MTNHDDNLYELAEGFRKFAVKQCKGKSSLYERFSLAIAEDRELLDLARDVIPGQPAPNILLGAIHLLLLQGYQHQLAVYYPSISDNVDVTGDPVPHLKSFCREYADEIRGIVSKHVVQTNVVNRCAVIVPALMFASEQNHGEPYHLFDIGASAGLTLLWDKYKYLYNENEAFGDLNSPVQIHCENRGDQELLLNFQAIQTLSRVGVDIAPVDIRNEEESLWLQALVWPTRTVQRDQLKHALDVARIAPPELICGDATEQLPYLINKYHDNHTAVVLFSWSIYQAFGSPGGRDRASNLLSNLSQRRPITEISIGHFSNEVPRIMFAQYADGEKKYERVFALSGVYGEWIQIL